jgi:hypothetical protein
MCNCFFCLWGVKRKRSVSAFQSSIPHITWPPLFKSFSISLSQYVNIKLTVNRNITLHGSIDIWMIKNSLQTPLVSSTYLHIYIYIYILSNSWLELCKCTIITNKMCARLRTLLFLDIKTYKIPAQAGIMNKILLWCPFPSSVQQ